MAFKLTEDEAAAAARRAYSQNGNLNPEEGGLDFWVNQLKSGAFDTQQDFNTNFNTSFANAAGGAYIPIQAGASAPGTQGSANNMPDWMAGLQNEALTPEQMAKLYSTVEGSGGWTTGTVSQNGYEFAPNISYGEGENNAGNNTLHGYTAFKEGAPRGDDDWYGKMGVDGQFEGARNPHEFDMGDATPFIFALAGGAAAMAPGAMGAAMGLEGAAAGGASSLGGTGAAVGGATSGGLTSAGYSAEMLAAMSEASAAFGGSGAAAAAQVNAIVGMGGAMDMATITSIGQAAGLNGAELTAWAAETGNALSLGGTGPNFSQGFTDNGTTGGALDSGYASGSAGGTGGYTNPNITTPSVDPATSVDPTKTPTVDPTKTVTPEKGIGDYIKDLLGKGGLDSLLPLLLAAGVLGNKGGGGGGGSQAKIPAYKANRGQTPYAQQRPEGSRPGGGGIDYFNRTSFTPMAAGGIASLAQGYSGGGDVLPSRQINGPGDGVSDSIPHMIDGRQPAALASDEFVVDARAVSELGNGSSEAGAKELYAMVERIHGDRKKAKVGKDSRATRHLPA